MSQSSNYSQSSTVLYWESILEKELIKVAALLEKKQSRLFALRNLSFDEQSESNYRTIKVLETEISVFVGLIGIVEELKKAYFEFTASVADKLVSLTLQCDYYRRELLANMARGGAYRP